MEVIISIFLGIATFFGLFYLISLKFNYWKLRGFPFINTLPFFEVFFDILLKSKCSSQTFQEIYDKLDGYKFGGFILFFRPVLMVCDPNLINHILISDFAYFQNKGALISNWEPLSTNVSSLTGEAWRNVRYKLTPVFSSAKVKLMFDQIKDCSCILTDYMKTKAGPFDVRYYTQKYNVNVIASVAMGLCPFRCSKTEPKKNVLFEISARYFSPSFKQVMKHLFRLSFPKISHFLKIKMIDDEVTDFFINLVHDTIEYRKKSGDRRNDFLQSMMDLKEAETLNQLNKSDHCTTGFCESQSNSNNNKVDFEDVEDTELMEQVKHSLCRTSEKAVFTDALIAAQVFSFVTIGSEAVSNTISFALFHLAVNLDVQNRLQNEIDSVISRDFSYNSLKKMTYMDQVINEVLRLHPIYGGFSRECAKDYVIPGTDKMIEKGTMVVVPVVALHRDPKYFPEPEKFNPDRFQDMNAVPKGVFFPFGAGPRICIAIRLALLEIKVFLAQMLSEFSITLSDKTQLPLKAVSISLSGHIVGGLWINCELRKKIQE